jgi:hypothetical protein
MNGTPTRSMRLVSTGTENVILGRPIAVHSSWLIR